MCACGPPLVSSRPPWLSFFYYFLCVSVGRVCSLPPLLVLPLGFATPRNDGNSLSITSSRQNLPGQASAVGAEETRAFEGSPTIASPLVRNAGRPPSCCCPRDVSQKLVALRRIYVVALKFRLKQRSRQFDCNQRPMSRSNRLENHVNSTFP